MSVTDHADRVRGRGPRVLSSPGGLRRAERDHDAVAVRARAVSWQGATIVLPGPSGSGSGTRSLFRALVTAGADPLCSEYVLIRRDGTILAFPDPGPGDGLPLALVADLVFSPADGWNVRQSSTGHAVLTLVDRGADHGRSWSMCWRPYRGVPR
jgi:hypothetical protein